MKKKNQQEQRQHIIGRLAPAKTAAQETGIKYTTLRDLVLKGELPVIRLGRAWYFDRADLERFIASRKDTGVA